MKNIIPKDSRYIPLTQQKWCCVPTCIQMIMVRQGVPLVPADLIGYHLGLVVPKEETQYFWNGRTGSRPVAGWGTQIGKTQYSPNTTFKKLKIPLNVSWSLIDTFKTLAEFRDYLADVGDKDILVCFDWPTLFDQKREGHWGHVCVLDKVFLRQDRVRIIDPDPNAPKWREVGIENLYNAMRTHGKDKSGGFWEFSSIRHSKNKSQ